jgi:hypothetical protein
LIWKTKIGCQKTTWKTKMKIGNWYLGWSRNVAIGVIWTRKNSIAIMFFGLTLSKNLSLVKKNK